VLIGFSFLSKLFLWPLFIYIKESKLTVQVSLNQTEDVKPKKGSMIRSIWACRNIARFPSSARFQSTDASVSISGILLKRSRDIAGEHSKLSAQNAETFDIARAKRIGELSSVTAALAEWETAQDVVITEPLSSVRGS
jgi:hypothetical protein